MAVTTRARTELSAPLRSTVGRKAVMAVTGGILVLFLVAHMIGNLKVFYGRASFDHYAHWLREIGAPVLPGTYFLWALRGVLAVSVVAHIWTATSLAIKARRARPVPYAHRPPLRASYAARTMRWGGVIILLFVIYHLLDLTTGDLNPNGRPAQVYNNVAADFAPERWYVTLVYTVTIVVLGFHLRHGVYSAVRSLGQHTPAGQHRARIAALVFSVALCAGFLAVPFAVLIGLVN